MYWLHVVSEWMVRMVSFRAFTNKRQAVNNLLMRERKQQGREEQEVLWHNFQDM